MLDIDDTGLVVGSAEVAGADFALERVFEVVVEHFFDLVVNLLGVEFLAILEVGRDAHGAVVVDGDDRGARLWELVADIVFEGLYVNGLVKLHDVVASSREVDATAKAASGDDEHGDDCHNDDAHDGGAHLALAHEVEVGVLHHVAGPWSGEGDIRIPAFVDEPLEDDAGEIYCGEERAADTHDGGDGKTLDGACSQERKDDHGNDGGQVGVEDCREGVAITVGHGSLEALASAQLFLDALEDEHVGVNGHTQSEHDTGDAWQGEHGLERG